MLRNQKKNLILLWLIQSHITENDREIKDFNLSLEDISIIPQCVHNI